MVSAKEIQTALERVRDTKETVAVGPYVFSFDHVRGLDRCRFTQKVALQGVFGADTVSDRVGGFTFAGNSLKRISIGLAREATS